jgi:hypothetical protein
MPKNSCVLLSNFPRNKHYYGCYSFPPRATLKRMLRPSLLNHCLIGTCVRVYVVATTPSKNLLSSPNGEPAIVEKMTRWLLHLIAKRTISTILLAPVLKTIRRSYPVLHHQPRNKLAFWRIPSPPNRCVERRWCPQIASSRLTWQNKRPHLWISNKCCRRHLGMI